jgi:hypothetical protein
MKYKLALRHLIYNSVKITVHFAGHRPQIGQIEQIYTDFKRVNSKNQCKSV